MWNTLLAPFRRRSAPVRNPRHVAYQDDTDRLALYGRYLRAYEGYSVRAPVSGTTPLETRKLRHNLNLPLIDRPAEFFAAKPLRWRVQGSAAATKAAFNIWDRSGSDRTLLENARCAGIYGDVVGLATQDGEGRPKIEFVAPDIAYPTFSGSDAQRLEALDLTWEEEDREGRRVVHREFYDGGGRQVFIDNEEVTEERQAWDALPAVWIRNKSMKGQSYGKSDLAGGVLELVEEYDHVASKRTRILDYYSEPNIVFKGMAARDLDKSVKNVFFIPADGDAFFLEWGGNQPDVETQLQRISDDIERITGTPKVAYGGAELGAFSGVALKILYGPLLAKCQSKWASWGPSLEYLMWLCLVAEGHAVLLEAVDALWEDPLPVDEAREAEGEKAAVDGGFRSVESALARLGAENPAREIKEIERDRRFEHLKLLTDAGAPLVWAAARAGFVEEELAELETLQAEQEEKAAAEAEARLAEMEARPAVEVVN